MSAAKAAYSLKLGDKVWLRRSQHHGRAVSDFVEQIIVGQTRISWIAAPRQDAREYEQTKFGKHAADLCRSSGKNCGAIYFDAQQVADAQFSTDHRWTVSDAIRGVPDSMLRLIAEMIGYDPGTRRLAKKEEAP